MLSSTHHIVLPIKQIKVPLEHGWKRKLVVVHGETSVIHYISPSSEGSKVFTNKLQVGEYLSSLTSPLSPDWFIFSPAVILEKALDYECEGEMRVLNRVPSSETEVMCSRSCPGRGGSRPSLSCKVCLTYFHPKCVHLDDSMDEFTCQSCIHLVELEQQSKRTCLESPAYTILPDRAVRIILLSLSTTRDLLNATKVCKQWYTLSKQVPALWKRAHFTNITLSNDWSCFKSHFSSLTKLDTRGMGFSNHINKIWDVLTPLLGSISTLKSITLGVVTSPVLSILLNSIKGIKHFEAQFIVHESTRKYNDNTVVSEIDLAACGSQPHLRHFTACSPTHLKLPTQCDLTLLRKLQRLQTLSLTGFVSGSLTEAGLGFITHLRNLSSLQLGACADWTDEQYAVLSNLTSLQHLRLESGPSDASVGLSTALVKLHQLVQLELIVFPIHRTLRDVIVQLPKLNLLNLAPTATSQEELARMNQLVVTLMREGSIWAGEWGTVIPHTKSCHNNTLVIPIVRAFVADSVLYKAASRRGQGDILMINVTEAKKLLEDCLPDNGISSVYTLSKNTAHWVNMCH